MTRAKFRPDQSKKYGAVDIKGPKRRDIFPKEGPKTRIYFFKNGLFREYLLQQTTLKQG
jgi:hypothetical protein